MISASAQAVEAAVALIKDWMTRTQDAFHAKPFFSPDEILKSKFYTPEDLVTVKIQDGEWIGVNGLARLVLLHALAVVDP